MPLEAKIQNGNESTKRFGMAYAEILYSELSLSAKGLYSILTTYTNGDGSCFPALNTLQKITKTSRNTLLKLMRELEGAEIIKVTRKNGIRNEYILYKPVPNIEPVQNLIPVPKIGITPVPKIGTTNTTESLTEREKEFKNEVYKYSEYPKGTLDDFIRCYTELDKGKTKMRFELQKTWETKKRLVTWLRNEGKWDKKIDKKEPEPAFKSAKPMII